VIAVLTDSIRRLPFGVGVSAALVALAACGSQGSPPRAGDMHPKMSAVTVREVAAARLPATFVGLTPRIVRGRRPGGLLFTRPQLGSGSGS
jgi:hypothetical protein